MDTNLLRSWLGLPPGPWPPGERELLATTTGSVDPAAAEQRAMALMSALRPHQLRHPELVTEGMNRIAQALLTVTAIGPSPAPSPIIPPKLATAPAASPRTSHKSIPTPTRPAPTILDAEVVEPLPPTVVPPPVFRAAPPVSVPAVSVDPIPLPVEDVGHGRADRRAAYAELAALRAVRRAWEKLGPFVGDPSESLLSPGHICEFLEAVSDVRRAVRHRAFPAGLNTDAAPIVDTITRQPLVLATFRSLTTSQRLQLARDWAVGRATFVDQYNQLRRRLVVSRPVRTVANRVREIGLILAHNPEWILVVGSLVVLSLVGLRARG